MLTLLQDCLPLVLMFDVNEEFDLCQGWTCYLCCDSLCQLAFCCHYLKYTCFNSPVINMRYDRDPKNLKYIMILITVTMFPILCRF